MPTHLSDVGIHFAEETLYEDCLRMLEENIPVASREVDAFGKRYLIVYISEDIEFWFPVGDKNNIDPMGFELHYNTRKWCDVVKPEWAYRNEEEMQGIAKIWGEDETITMNVCIPNAAFSPEFMEGKTYKCQIACFAEDMQRFKTADEFHKKYEKMSEKAFIPTGQFSEAENSSRGWICGVVKSVEEKKNTYTGRKYLHIVLESWGFDFDVLADTSFAETGFETGDILTVGVWMSGKIRSRYVGDEQGNLKRLKPNNKDLETLEDLYSVLRKSWCRDTAYPSCQMEWDESNPSYGQCAITAMLVHDMFGGTIHRIRPQGGGTHYFNKINGRYIDLTSEQFNLFDSVPEYEPNEEMNRNYCGKNPDTKKRFDLLVKRILENLG